MEAISLAEAKARLSSLVDRAESGESICITRRGKAVARIVPIEVPDEPFDWEALERHAATIPHQAESAGAFMRRIRDEERY
jgi:prevent-host-death family protein